VGKQGGLTLSFTEIIDIGFQYQMKN
jgi:hypothetical protein